MDREIFINRVIIVVLAIAVLFSFSRGNSLATRLQILETSVGKLSRTPQTSPLLATDDGRTLRQICAALRGRISGSGQSVFCDLPKTTVAIQAPSQQRTPAASGPGEGVEIHYAEWSRRECTEVKGAAKCDPLTKALKCNNGTPRLIRVALTPNGKGLRNRYVCN